MLIYGKNQYNIIKLKNKIKKMSELMSLNKRKKK